MTTETQNNDTREVWLNDFIELARPHFEAAGHPIPINLRVSVGFPSTGYKSSTVAECWWPEASDDNHYELFVTPTTLTDARIAGLVTHELAHAAVDAKTHHRGHGAPFKVLATAMGLEGPMRSTTEGENWFAWAAPILALLGPMPYAAIKANAAPPRPKKKTYLLKVECPDCGWLARVTASHCHEGMTCPVPTCDGHLWVDGSNDDPQ